MKRVICLFLAVVCVFSLAACSGQSKEEERIERVLGRMFTCPDEELKALIERSRMIYDAGDPAPNPEKLVEQQRAQEAYAEHLKANIFTAEDLTEEFQAKFCGELYFLTNFPVFCLEADAVLSMASVEIECVSEENRSYAYTAELVIKMDGEEIPFMQKGKLQMSEDGRISWIDPYVFNDLAQLFVDRINAKLAGTSWEE